MFQYLIEIFFPVRWSKPIFFEAPLVLQINLYCSQHSTALRDTNVINMHSLKSLRAFIAPGGASKQLNFCSVTFRNRLLGTHMVTGLFPFLTSQVKRPQGKVIFKFAECIFNFVFTTIMANYLLWS